MDKKYIEENNFNDAVEHFQYLAEYKHPKQSLKRLYEYSFYHGINEDGEEEQQQPQDTGMNQGQTPQDSMPPQNSPMDAQNQMTDNNGQMGNEMPPQGTEMPSNDNMAPQGDMQQPPMDNNMPMDDNMQEPPMGDMEAIPQDEGNIETQEMEPDDEVIDVDELTQSQEATEYKIDGVDDRLTQIFKVVQKFADQLDKNEQSITDLKNEFEKRNPTQTEKFNLRSQASGPFNQTPSEYWDDFSQKNPNYEIMRNNKVSPSDEQKEYKITKGDIDGLNMKSIADTLNVDQDLKKYIGF